MLSAVGILNHGLADRVSSRLTAPQACAQIERLAGMLVRRSAMTSLDGSFTMDFDGVGPGTGNFDVLRSLIWGRTTSGPASPTLCQSST
jgi:hypothetical protein